MTNRNFPFTLGGRDIYLSCGCRPKGMIRREIWSLFDRPDEVQIVIANSELAIERGDFEKALKILGDVTPDSPAYVRVHVRCVRLTANTVQVATGT